MLGPRKVQFEARKKERENLEFHTFLKRNADDKELDEQYLTKKDTEGNWQTKHKPCDFLQENARRLRRKFV